MHKNWATHVFIHYWISDAKTGGRTTGPQTRNTAGGPLDLRSETRREDHRTSDAKPGGRTTGPRTQNLAGGPPDHWTSDPKPGGSCHRCRHHHRHHLHHHNRRNRHHHHHHRITIVVIVINIRILIAIILVTVFLIPTGFACPWLGSTLVQFRCAQTLNKTCFDHVQRKPA